MKKIGIITMIDNENCGNRLQNFALQTCLEKLDCNVITIKNDRLLNDHKDFYINYLRYIKKIIKNKLTNNKIKEKNFNKFNKYIKFSKMKITCKSKRIASKYDYFVVGSDQVWKPTRKRMSYVDLLSFAKSSQKISYAASFGIDKINSDAEKKLKNALKDFKSISVREDAGKVIINKVLKNKKVEVLVDPTMLLTEKEWEKLENKPSKINNKKIILTYYLGENIYLDFLKNNYNKNEYQIINFLEKNNVYGPSEFLYLIHNADLVLTDSFHACVFSIIFNTKFYVFDRKQEDTNNNMNSRLYTLLEKFNLKNRMISDIKFIQKDESCDFKINNSILEKEREKALKFLKKALDINE